MTVRIDAPVDGVALVAAVGPTPKKRFTEQFGVAAPETMDQIAVALRAVFDLA